MCDEMKKASPRDHVLLPLLKSTYEDRRTYIEFDSKADVRSMLETYPALRCPAAVCLYMLYAFKCTLVFMIFLFQIEQDMFILMSSYIQDSKSTFQGQWTTVYVPAILSYREKSKKKGVSSVLGEMKTW